MLHLSMSRARLEIVLRAAATGTPSWNLLSGKLQCLAEWSVILGGDLLDVVNLAPW